MLCSYTTQERYCGKGNQMMRSDASSAELPSPSEGIERVDKLTILGVVVNSRLTATDHVDGLMSINLL